MDQGLSCRDGHEDGLFKAIRLGDLETVEALLAREPSLMYRTTHDCDSALHIAAANGQTEILSMLLERCMNPDSLNRHEQTPLMLAAKHGKISCVLKLLEIGANILVFDSDHRKTCLHYAAYYGHSDCLQAILSAFSSSPVAASWGFARFVNIEDGRGATPLHLASRRRWPECVHILLVNGALASASTGGYGTPGFTPLHLAARAGSLDCIRELLAWGADRLQIDLYGRIPYVVALRHRRGACAALLNPSSAEPALLNPSSAEPALLNPSSAEPALLNPSSAEPLVWPSHLKFISELNQDTKVLLENALMEANNEREKKILKRSDCYIPSPSHSEDGLDDNISEASDPDLCSICFEQVCVIEVQDCGHQMCAHCTLSLCCHNKPNPATSPPVCPFCRSTIARLVVAKIKSKEETDHENSKLRKGRKSRNLSESSSSFKGISRIGDVDHIALEFLERQDRVLRKPNFRKP